MILGKSFLHNRITFKSLKLTLILLSLILLMSSSAFAVAIESSTEYFELGIDLEVYGDSYLSNEDITIQVKYTNDFIYDSWSTSADVSGSFYTTWETPIDYNLPDTLIIVSTGDSSGYIASTTVILSNNIFHHLLNGTLTASPQWHNGNVNSSNSCYEEGSSVAHRYFVSDQNSGTSHHFTIQADAIKNYFHTFDYFTDYDFSEASAIASIGGVCSPIAAAAPADCSNPTGTYAFPDPTDSTNYVSVPIGISDIVNGSFTASGTQHLSFYNVVIDSVSKYFFTGTEANAEINLTIYFTVIDDGSVGFFMGGHLAEGLPNTWGVGNGAGSVGGAPYHMSVVNYDGGGGANQDRSVQGIFVPSVPEVNIIYPDSDIDSICYLTNSICSTTATAEIYTWTITGGTIVSGQGTNFIEYTATGSPGTNITISLEACNNSGCSDDTYCATESISILIGDCNPCEIAISCPPDVTISCDASVDPSNTGTATYSATGNCPTLSLNHTDSFVAGSCSQEQTIYRLWEVSDNQSNILASCTQTITVEDNLAPTFDQTCPADIVVECDNVPQAPTLTATDNCDLAPVVTFNETTTPGSCDNSYTITRTWTATDECNNSTTSAQTITVQDTTYPTLAGCPTDITVSCDNIPVPANVIATDNCDPTPVITFNETTIPGSCDNSYTLTRTWTATDDCGNSSSC
ncbi:MAG: hypothetical protein U9N54_03530, partial [candidate division Zixibacteria bacterium]|nr:hypothetical protein [candidate division Zixibacteria bacterium]